MIHSPQRGDPDRECAHLYQWLGAAWLVLQLFVVFDWHYGLVRLLLLLSLGVWLVLFRRAAPRLAITAFPTPRWNRIAHRLFALGIGANAAVALVCAAISVATGHVRSDQAESVVNALRVMAQHTDPYAATTATDMVAYGEALRELANHPQCRASSNPVRFRLGRVDDTVVPRIRSSTECEATAGLFQAIGFKYGPVVLFFYWPFIRWLGAAGFVVAHAFLAAACTWLLWRWTRHRGAPEFWANSALLLFLWPTHLAWNTFINEHIDLLPVALALVAWYCFDRRRFTTGAALLAFSIGAKTLPGLLFVPLVAAGPSRNAGVLIAVTLLVFAPFAAWNWTGFWHNFGYPFIRPPDSTSALAFLSAREGLLLRAAAAIVIVVLAFRLRNRGAAATIASAEFLAGTHVAALASATTIHNNYFVWLLPVLVMYSAVESIPYIPPASLEGGTIPLSRM
jgi:hypothetical protein